ncbi:MAG TPA: haloalkane dehalogenase [Kofleriaceae bacterium]|nr:haloalkane dehalogenase [Kofleriaceae bacterium]
MDYVRTPDERFANLPGYDFAPHYCDVGGLRMHYLDEGPRDGTPVLLLHGEPSWSFLYRHMIPVITAAGFRAIAPDLIGFGRSDKPTAREAYTYQAHVAWMEAFIEQLGAGELTLVCQDWGGLIGLRLVAFHPTWFARVVAANTFLPTGREPVPDAFRAWRQFSQTTPSFDVGRIVNGATTTDLTPEVIAGYDAPFPDDSYKAGARAFPVLVPIEPNDPEGVINQQAWAELMKLDKPCLTAFSDKDPITRGADRLIQAAIPGARNQPHTTICGGGHFLQEDRGAELARVVCDFIAAT